MHLLIFAVALILPLVQGQGAPGLPGAPGYGGLPGLPGAPGYGSGVSSGNDAWINALLRQYLAEESQLGAGRKHGHVGSMYFPSDIYPFYFPFYFPYRYGAGGAGGSGGGFGGGAGGAPGMPGEPGY